MLTDERIDEVTLEQWGQCSMMSPESRIKWSRLLARAIEDLVCAECMPPGFVAVPVEPTPEMTWAATVTADHEWCYHVGRGDAKKLWAAMLAAAPSTTPKDPT